MRKWLISITTCIFLIGFLAYNAHAFENLDEKKLNLYLQKAGYPSEVIETLEPEQKHDLYMNRALYVSFQKKRDNLSDSKTDNSAGTMRILTLSNFTHTLLVSRIPSSISGIARFKVDYNWDWNSRAINNLWDKFGIAWSDDYDALMESVRYSYVAYGINGNRQYTTKKMSSSSYDKYTPGAGIGWKFDLLHHFTQNNMYYEVYRHKGWGGVYIQTPHDGSGRADTSSATASYFHQQFDTNGTLSFSGGAVPDIGIGYSLLYDESPNKGFSWSWYHNNY
ncbi:hypothetical protein [Brevibacillus dissolubilis]|uniref:hypothetical protein n=1 Tax=Brevibacillus dissolubilis TaxID=1844116 RepID=UPI001116B55E|nr:hypothetical protein [Brevibacillus dissolubilis]